MLENGEGRSDLNQAKPLGTYPADEAISEIKQDPYNIYEPQGQSESPCLDI